MDGTCGTYGWGKEIGASDFDGNIEGTRSLWRIRNRLEDNIKIVIEEVEWGGMD